MWKNNTECISINIPNITFLVVYFFLGHPVLLACIMMILIVWRCPITDFRTLYIFRPTFFLILVKFMPFVSTKRDIQSQMARIQPLLQPFKITPYLITLQVHMLPTFILNVFLRFVFTFISNIIVQIPTRYNINPYVILLIIVIFVKGQGHGDNH